jgi:hypothetical protein
MEPVEPGTSGLIRVRSQVLSTYHHRTMRSDNVFDWPPSDPFLTSYALFSIGRRGRSQEFLSATVSPPQERNRLLASGSCRHATSNVTCEFLIIINPFSHKMSRIRHKNTVALPLGEILRQFYDMFKLRTGFLAP